MPYSELSELSDHLIVKLNEPLKAYSYTETGGPADALVFPKDLQGVIQLVQWAEARQCPLTVLGNLSNLIVRDGGIEGVVVILTEMDQMTVKGNMIMAEAGASLIDVSRLALTHSLTGLEFACGIPGSLGGAIYMNAGAYGGEMKDLPLKIQAISRDGQVKTYQGHETEFAYRRSIFQDNQEIILAVQLELSPGKPQQIKSEMARLTQLRESKQPLELPSCGSVFKRPEGHYTGQLIQEAGLQGYRIGGAEVSKKHAGFIVNQGGATASDYIQLIQYIQETILERYQVVLETEVRIIGRDI